MGTTTLRGTHPVTGNWSDATNTLSGSVNVAGLLKNCSGLQMEVIKGGVAPTATDHGIPIQPWDAEYCETDHIWIRTTGGANATVAFDVIS
jgi:hypothetical protein